MNVPAAAPATANSIVVQFRSRPAAVHRGDAKHYCIPPMSLLFVPDGEGTKDSIRDVVANQDCFSGTAPGRSKFCGVSMGGLDGSTAMKYGKAHQDRFTAIVRGEATIMVPYSDVSGIQLGEHVKAKSYDSVNKPFFRNFDECRTFSIEKANAEDDEAIGVLIRKPDRRSPAHWATVVLF